MNEYTIKPKESFPEKIGELVWMLEHVREVTLQEVATLTQSELDFLPSDGANSIGSLLVHIASIEFVYQVISFENRDLTKGEHSKWGTALELGDRARDEIVHHPLDYYLKHLAQVREKTRTLLKLKNDQWLYEEEWYCL